jgi:hypothetical protein
MQAWATIGKLAQDLGGDASRSPQKLPVPTNPAPVATTAIEPHATVPAAPAAAAGATPPPPLAPRGGPPAAPQGGPAAPLQPTEEETCELEVPPTQQGLVQRQQSAPPQVPGAGTPRAVPLEPTIAGIAGSAAAVHAKVRFRHPA